MRKPFLVVAEPPNISLSAHEPRKPILLKPRKRILLKHGLHAAFDFPLYAEGRLQAVLEFFSTTPQLPDKHVLFIVESIGEQLGRVLERQRGQEQQRQALAISDALNLATIRSDALEKWLQWPTPSEARWVWRSD
jgi:GAF domain-containing protein